MIHVLFVCLGNICRSPMAEAVLRHRIEQEGLTHSLKVDSAGTGGYHAGEQPHAEVRRLLAARGISTAGVRARKLTAADLDEFDHVIAMDESNLRHMEHLATPANGKKLRLLSSYVAHAKWTGVPDPWYTGDFDETIQLVQQGCEALLERLKEELRD